ncbi:MAG: hypothetical protein ABH879_02300 [archaeon]
MRVVELSGISDKFDPFVGPVTKHLRAVWVRDRMKPAKLVADSAMVDAGVTVHPYGYFLPYGTVQGTVKYGSPTAITQAYTDLVCLGRQVGYDFSHAMSAESPADGPNLEWSVKLGPTGGGAMVEADVRFAAEIPDTDMGLLRRYADRVIQAVPERGRHVLRETGCREIWRDSPFLSVAVDYDPGLDGPLLARMAEAHFDAVGSFLRKTTGETPGLEMRVLERIPLDEHHDFIATRYHPDLASCLDFF